MTEEIKSRQAAEETRNPVQSGQRAVTGGALNAFCAREKNTNSPFGVQHSLHPFLNTICNGDCLKILPKFPARCFDFVLTDPTMARWYSHPRLAAKRAAVETLSISAAKADREFEGGSGTNRSTKQRRVV